MGLKANGHEQKWIKMTLFKNLYEKVMHSLISDLKSKRLALGSILLKTIYNILQI